MSNVVINFLGNTDGLKPVDDVLSSITDKAGDVGAAWKKTSGEITESNKQNITSTANLGKSIEGLGVAAKSLDKNVIGGAYKEYLRQLQAQLGLTSKELIAYVQNARKAAQEAIFTAEDDQEVDELRISIEAMNDQLKELGAFEDEAGNKTQSLRARLREAKEELVAMAEAGHAGTPAFEALKEKAGALDDQMRDLNATVKNVGSDTKNIDGLISLASGVAGGFAVAQGAAALFGDENEEIQKALLKVNAAMSILQGLQQVQNVLQKESAASLLFSTKARVAQTTAVTTETIAEAENIAVTEADVVVTNADATAKVAQGVATTGAANATKGFNAVLAANPVGIIIVGILALIKAISLLTDTTRASAKEQGRLDNAYKDASRGLDLSLAAIERTTAKELALAKQRGASEAEQARIRGQFGNQRLKAINDEINAANKALAATIAIDEKSEEKRKELNDKKVELEFKLQSELSALEVEGYAYRQKLAEDDFASFSAFSQAKVAATISGTDAEKVAQIKSIREIAAAREETTEFKSLTPGEQALARAEDERQIQGLQLANYQHYLKGRTSAEEAYVANSKLNLIRNEVDTIDSITRITNAQISALKRQKAEAEANPTLNAGERAKIVAETNLQIAELERQNQLKILDIQKSGINAQLILSKKGSQDEYDNRVALINKEQEISLRATELTQNQINEINAKSFKEREAALRAFNQAQLQEQVDLDNAALENFAITESSKLFFTLKRINEQRKIELLQADGNAAKIAAIEAKYTRETLDIELAAIETAKNKRLESFAAFSEGYRKLQQQIIDSTVSDVEDKDHAVENLRRSQQDQLQIIFGTLEDRYAKEIEAAKGNAEALEVIDRNYNVAYQILQNQRVEINEAAEKLITESHKKETEKKIAQFQSFLNVLQTGLNAVLPADGYSNAITQIQNFGEKAFEVFRRLKDQVDSYNRLIEKGNAADATDEDKEKGALAFIEKEKAQKAAALEAEVAAILATQSIINGIFADNAAQRQAELDAEISKLEEQKSKELDNAKLTAEQKAAIEKKYDDKEREVKQRAYEADKAAKRQQAVINGALAITNIIATTPKFDFGIATALLVASAIASTAAAIAKINSTQVPKFFKGKIDIKGQGTKTSDSIPAMISAGESVIKADSTAKWRNALEAINEDRFEDYLSQKFADFTFPQVPETPAAISNNYLSIDYEKMGSAIAGKMPDPVVIENNFDDEKMQRFFRNGNNKTEYKNRRYSMKP